MFDQHQEQTSSSASSNTRYSRLVVTNQRYHPSYHHGGVKRQGAGVGEACNAILTDGDTGSGMAVKEAGQNAASLLQSAGARRQLDKVGAGTAALVDLADPDLASYQEGLTDTIDGDGTSDSAVVGEQLGGLEVEAGEGAGNLVPSKLPAAA
jgi:hypothetical protein